MLTTVYLVRHAQANPLPNQAEPDWALSARGLAQAEALVPVLATLGIHRIYTSPFRRCCETMRPFAESAGLPLAVHDGLRERCLSSSWIGDFREVWQRSWADYSFALAGGESSHACRERMAAAVSEIVQRHSGETLALASHGFSIGLFLTTVDPSCGGVEASALRTPDLLKFTHDERGFRWHRDYRAGEAFDALATDFRQTPGIVA